MIFSLHYQCVLERVSSESVSEQPAFEELSELQGLSELYALCSGNSQIVNNHHLDQQRSSTPVHGGLDESERFISNLDEIILGYLSRFYKRQNRPIGKFVTFLNKGISEMQ